MTEVIGIIAFIGLGLALLIGFHLLDNWHKRKAWRDAEREAHEYMRLHHGKQLDAQGNWVRWP